MQSIQAPTIPLVLIRHGESEWNKSNFFCGWYDAPLSVKGLESASSISAAALLNQCLKFDCIYTSALKRAHQTVQIITEVLQAKNIPITHDWRLNERHYGNLTGYNKRQMADKYGETQVQIWRRSFDVVPPAITPDNPYYNDILNNTSFSNVPPEQFPLAESLQMVIQRVIPLWENNILPKIKQGCRILIVAHGTVLRALIKHIDNISDADISKVNVPNSIPCVYEFNQETGCTVGQLNYLADESFLSKEIEKTAAIGN